MSSLETVLSYGAKIDSLMDELLKSVSPEVSVMLRYFMGYTETDGAPAKASGKRFRPAIMLYIAEALGVLKEALPAAVSVEMYHNFSLIHDDVEDNDEIRRGRPTVWKLWGVNSAINAGDAQLVLALQALRPLDNGQLQDFLLARFLEVIEGQQMDLLLSDEVLGSPAVTETRYLEMIAKKSAALVAAATAAPAFLAEWSIEKHTALQRFGFNVGTAYQLFDDRQALWGEQSKTGKNSYGDLRERKKTFPVLHAHATLLDDDTLQLTEFFTGPSTNESVLAAFDLIEKSGAKEAVTEKIAAYTALAFEALAETGITEKTQETLRDAIRELTT